MKRIEATLGIAHEIAGDSTKVGAVSYLVMSQMARDYIALDAENDRLIEALQRIDDWANAYPETAFREPDLEGMRKALTDAGMPTALDAAHGTWGRHILSGVREITNAALNDGSQ